MKLFLSESARTAFESYKKEVPDLAERIKLILKDILLHPEKGSGSPTRLTGPFSGFWERTVQTGHVIIYSFDSTSVKIASVGPEPQARNAVKLESYSQKEEQSVMKLMAENRGHDTDPKVGIFWYNRATNQLFGVVSHRLSDYTKANASDGRITCSEMHEDVWKKEFHKQKYQHGGHGPFIGAYQDKPRGRVFYHINTGTFEIAAGKWIEDYPQAYDLILKEFNLPADKSSLKYAIHWDIGHSWR